MADRTAAEPHRPLIDTEASAPAGRTRGAPGKAGRWQPDGRWSSVAAARAQQGLLAGRAILALTIQSV